MEMDGEIIAPTEEPETPEASPVKKSQWKKVQPNKTEETDSSTSETSELPDLRRMQYLRTRNFRALNMPGFPISEPRRNTVATSAPIPIHSTSPIPMSKSRESSNMAVSLFPGYLSSTVSSTPTEGKTVIRPEEIVVATPFTTFEKEKRRRKTMPSNKMALT